MIKAFSTISSRQLGVLFISTNLMRTSRPSWATILMSASSGARYGYASLFASHDDYLQLNRFQMLTSARIAISQMHLVVQGAYSVGISKRSLELL